MSGSDWEEDLDSPAERLEPDQLVIYDEMGTPIRDPSSPTKSKGKERRVALGELTPGTVALRSRRPAESSSILGPRDTARLPRPRPRPIRPSSELTRRLTVTMHSGHEWTSGEVRFVLWYYCRTVLQFDSIATAYNSTYPQADPVMNSADAETIVEKVKLTWEQIKRHLETDHFPVPNSRGWHPCDHHMACSNMEREDQRTIMRNPKTRVAGVKLIKEILTTMWEGSWEELLQCPRNHEMAQEVNTDQLASGSHHSTNRENSTPLIGREQRAGGLHRSNTRDPSAQPRENSRNNQSSHQDYHRGNADQSGLDQWRDARHHPFRFLVRTAGGPKVLYHFINVALKFVLFFSLTADWYCAWPEERGKSRPVPEKRFIRAAALSWESFLFMGYGGFRLLDDFLNFMKFEVLMFQGVDEPPPLSIVQKIFWSIVGVIAASGWAALQGWTFDGSRKSFPENGQLQQKPPIIYV